MYPDISYVCNMIGQSANMCHILCLLILVVMGLADILPVTNFENTEKYAIASSECPHPFQNISNGCYWFSTEQMDFYEASAYCKSLALGLDYEISLVMLDYDKYEDQALLEAVATAKDKIFWVGGIKLGIEWMWLDGRLVRRHAPFWSIGEPNQEEKCKCMAAEKGIFIPEAHNRSHIYNYNCKDSLNFICQIGNIKCPVDFNKIGNYCYLQSWTIEAPDLPWQAARDYCQSLAVHNGYQADLVVLGLEDQDDYYLVNNLTASYSDHYIWIGAYRPNAECHYQWVDGRDLSLNSIYWQDAEPRCESTNSVRLYHFSGWDRALIYDSIGDHSYPFICQMFKYT